MKSRKTMATAIAATIAIIAALTVSRSQSTKDSPPPDPQIAVLDRLTEIQKAAQALDADKVFSFVLDNDSGSLAQNGKLFLTRNDALESTRQAFQGLQNISYRFDQQHVMLLSPTVALAVGEGSSSANTEDGRVFTNRFAQSVVLVLTNSEWKVIHAHRSFLPAK